MATTTPKAEPVLVDGEDSSEEEDDEDDQQTLDGSSAASTTNTTTNASGSRTHSSSSTASIASSSKSTATTTAPPYDMSQFNVTPDNPIQAALQQGILPTVQHQLNSLRTLKNEHQELLKYILREQQNLDQLVNSDLKEAQATLRKVPVYEGRIRAMLGQIAQLQTAIDHISATSQMYAKEVSFSIEVGWVPPISF